MSDDEYFDDWRPAEDTERALWDDMLGWEQLLWEKYWRKGRAFPSRIDWLVDLMSNQPEK